MLELRPEVAAFAQAMEAQLRLWDELVELEETR